MNALILLLLLLTQGDVPSKGFRFEGRILREGFTRDQTPPPLKIRLTDMAPTGREGTAKAFTADVGADGFFEFSALPPGLYSLYLFPGMQPSAMAISVVHINEDIGDFWLTVPLSAMSVPVRTTVTLEGPGPLPSFQLALNDMKAGAVGNTIVMSEVPVGEYAVRLIDLPEGYSIKSIREGQTNLQTERLRVHPASPPLIEITLTPSNNLLKTP